MKIPSNQHQTTQTPEVITYIQSHTYVWSLAWSLKWKCLFDKFTNIYGIDNTQDSFHANAFREIDNTNTSDELANIAMNEEPANAENATSERTADSSEAVEPAESIEDISDDQSSNIDVAEATSARPQEESSSAAGGNDDTSISGYVDAKTPCI